MSKIEAFRFNQESKTLQVLDQTKLPLSYEFVTIENCDQGHQAIKDMLVRGAPCIAAVGCLSLIVHLNKMATNFQSMDELKNWFKTRAEHMISSRPTAVNLAKAIARLVAYMDEQSKTFNMPLVIDRLTNYCSSAMECGLIANQQLASYGALEIYKKSGSEKVSILTHCNTGSLATVGYGTALGVIRYLHKMGYLERAYCTETRPYNQGSRLTAWELVEEQIPATLIADNMVAYLMSTKQIHAVVVGADRVAANGDTANKIGTLQIAVTAKHYGVPFYVAAPTQSIDFGTPDASSIEIEQRPADELRNFALADKSIQLAPANVDVMNPCFDVTGSDLIHGIITEYGVCCPKKIREFFILLEDRVDRKLEALF